MASENENCAHLAHEASSSNFHLSNLRKRSQLDFEIEFFERIFSRDPNYVEVLMNLGELFTRKGCHRRALQVDLRLAQLRPRSATVMYNLACSYALLSRNAEAIDSIREAIRLGFADLEHLLSDDDLASLRALPGFQQVVADLATNPPTQCVI